MRAYNYVLINLFQNIVKQFYITLMHPEHIHFVQSRAGDNGTDGTAMAVPVFEGEKMASLGF